MKTSIQIEYDKKEDQKEVRRLWQAAFHDPESFADYYFQWVFPENQIITAKEGNQLRSMLHLNPYPWHWEKSDILQLHYIVGVATEAEFRRQGLMAQCLTKALQDMEKAGDPFTYLMPAKQEYYLPFQFVPLQEEKRWVRRGTDWYCKEGEKWEKGIPKGIAEKQKPCFPLRSQAYRERLKAEVECENGGLIEWGTGNYCAYVLDQREKQPTAVIQQLFIEESKTETKAGLRNTIDILEYQICPELYSRYGEVAVEYIETQNMMLRILDIRRFLEILPYEKESQQLPICLSDPICERNNGTYLLTLSDKGNTLKPLSETISKDLPIYQWDIGELAVYLLKEFQLAEKLYLMEIV